MNYLILNQFKLGNYVGNDDLKEYNNEFLDLCVSSYKQNLSGEWQLKVLQGNLETLSFLDGYNKMQQNTFEIIKDHCRKNDNVFYVDIDTVCVNKVEIFNKYDHMLMPGGRRTNNGDIILSGSVIYFPCTISDKAWQTGSDAIYNIKNWGDVQLSYNKMVRVDGDILFDSKLNYNEIDFTNNCSKEEACIISFHGSRGKLKALNRMKEILKGKKIK